ncbi:MAG: hypothetical protein CMJ83_09815 [Planctomycetes bacterium]|nr:hypothetical protein [Planctomycetota bacterium]
MSLAGCAHAPTRRTSVLIVGGGLAGTRALDLLRRGGHDAHLLEGGARLGGRIRTARDGLPEGSSVELGAERVPDGCPRLQALVRELGLTTLDYPATSAPYALRMDGSTHRFRTPAELPEKIRGALHERERDRWPFHLHLAYCRKTDPVPAGDSRSGLEWLRDQGVSKLGERFIRNFFPEPVDRMSAHGFWLTAMRFLDSGVSRTLDGGLDQLVHRLADRHREHITIGADVSTIALDQDGVTARDRDGRTWRANHIVLALPLKSLDRIRFSPRRPEVIARWTIGRAVAAEVRIHVDYEEDELRRRDVNSTIMGFDFPRVTWASPSVTSPGRRILSSVSFHDEIDSVRETLAQGGVDGLRRLLRARLPQVTTLGPRVWTEDLNADPRIGGTFPYPTPGAPPKPDSVRESRLILAGGDFSSWPGSMEGALESAETAAHSLSR